MAKRKPTWDAGGVRALRRHLGLSQQQLADELGTRQQTISEWETGVYQPRGMSERLLALIADRSSFSYGASPDNAGPIDAGSSNG
jgi:DNA-binding transcriptional regulator YiaG